MPRRVYQDKRKGPSFEDPFVTTWLGWLGSDQRVRVSETRALPLGYTPRRPITLHL